MRGGKGTRGGSEACSPKRSAIYNQWPGPEGVLCIAYDLAGHKYYLIDKALCRRAKLSYANNYGAVRALCKGYSYY